jgi:predicted RNA-binding protein with PIN domain
VSNQELVDEIDLYCHHLRRSAIIVFDGFTEDKLDTPNVEVVYAGDADAEILKMIKKTKTPSEITLVTSDKEIIFAARGKKIKAIKSEDFDFRVVDKINDDDEKEESYISNDDVSEMLEEFNHFRK